MAKKSNKSDTAESLNSFIDKPSLRINETDLPEIKNWNIDGEYTLTVKVKMTAISRHDYDSPKKIWGTFDVESVKADGEQDPLRKGMDSVPVTQTRKK
jgi:hypothetical protein